MNPPIRKIKASVLVKDLEAQMNDFQVMQKHGLNEEQLEYLFHKMVQAGLIKKQLLEVRAGLAETNITKAFVQVQQSMDELDQVDDTTPPRAHANASPELPAEEGPSVLKAGPSADDESVYADALRAMAEEAVPLPYKRLSDPFGRKTIRASDLIRDITSGMTDPMLMDKYQLTPKQLQFMLRKLVEAGKITETQLLERTSVSSTSITKAFVDVYQSLRELDEGDWG